MENELIRDTVYVVVCGYCNTEFIVKKDVDSTENIKDIVESTYGWCGTCVDGNS